MTQLQKINDYYIKELSSFIDIVINLMPNESGKITNHMKLSAEIIKNTFKLDNIDILVNDLACRYACSGTVTGFRKEIQDSYDNWYQSYALRYKKSK